MEKQMNRPQLRFPEFTGEWEKKRLGEVADKNVKWSLTGGPFGSDLKASDYVEEGVRVIQLQNMGDGEFIDTSKIYTSNKKADKLLSCNIYPNEIIISKMGDPVARACIIPNIEIRYLMCSDGIRLVVDKKHFDNYFIFLSINYKKFREEALSKSTGSTRKRIGLSELKEIQVSYPSLPEQTKIATFLSAVDEKIQALKKKHSLLEQYKKGVMQKLFSQELRFRDENGKDFPEWSTKKIGDCLDYEQPTNYLVSSTEYSDKHSTPVVTAGKTFILGYTDETSGIFSDGLPVIIFDDFTTASQFVDFPFKAKSSAMKILKAKENADIKFMYEALQMINYETGAHGRHWISVFAEMEILIPDYKEQIKISSFLSAIDKKINSVNTILLQTEIWKKGLLQKMFV